MASRAVTDYQNNAAFVTSLGNTGFPVVFGNSHHRNNPKNRSADQGGYGRELWKSNGPEGGTVLADRLTRPRPKLAAPVGAVGAAAEEDRDDEAR